MKALFAILTLLVACSACAQPTVEIPVAWAAPTTGSPVDHYQLQLATDGGAFVNCCTSVTTGITLTLQTGHTYIARVAGIDAKGRQGIWSMDSPPYEADAGAPGRPGIVIFPATKR